MSIPSQIIRQRDFSAGEIDPDAQRRDDTDVFKFGVRKGRNLQTTRTGAIERRFGRRWLYNDGGMRDEFRPFPTETYQITFGTGVLRVRDMDGAVVATLSAPWGNPWGADGLPSLCWDAVDNQLFITGDGIRPQVVTKAAPGSAAWSIAPFQFALGLSGKVLAPFARLDAKGVSMTPSGLSGNITVTFSAPILTSAHVGVVYRYAGRQLRITAITNATTASATVIETLNPTVQYSLDVADEGKTFSVGEIAETSVSGVQIEIIAVDVLASKVTGVVLNRYRKRGSGDRLVGPASDATIENMAILSPPGGTSQWDEVVMSDYRGWPRSVSTDVQRLILTDFPSVKQGIGWSAVNEPTNFNVSDDPAGGIFERIQAQCRVFHVIGGYDEFAITDEGAFYIPVSTDSPLAPGSVEFRAIYTGTISRVRPIQVTEGVIFVDGFGSGLYAIAATGQTARPYAASEITEFHRHLFSGVRSLAASAGNSQSAARHLYAVNGDGTMAVGQYSADRQYVGWLPWQGAGQARHVYSRQGRVVLSVNYPDLSNMEVAERIEEGLLLDCTQRVVGGVINAAFAGAVMQVLADGFFLGDVMIGVGGVVPDISGYSNVLIGKFYDWELVPNIAGVEGGEAYGQRMRRRKVKQVKVAVSATQEFQCGNRLLAGYVGGDDMAMPLPMRTGVFPYRQAGRSYDPTFSLKQSFPGAFKLLELTTEVTV